MYAALAESTPKGEKVGGGGDRHSVEILSSCCFVHSCFESCWCQQQQWQQQTLQTLHLTSFIYGFHPFGPFIDTSCSCRNDTRRPFNHCLLHDSCNGTYPLTFIQDRDSQSVVCATLRGQAATREWEWRWWFGGVFLVGFFHSIRTCK